METNARSRALEARGHARPRLNRASLTLLSFGLLGMAGAMAPSRLWAAGAGREPDPLSSVLDHMYNVEFQPVRQLLELWLKQHPTDLRAWNYLAESILDQEMLNEGLLSTGAYLDRGEAFRKRNAPLRDGRAGKSPKTLRTRWSITRRLDRYLPGGVGRGQSLPALGPLGGGRTQLPPCRQRVARHRRRPSGPQGFGGFSLIVESHNAANTIQRMAHRPR